jgi:hypothetical protein
MDIFIRARRSLANQLRQGSGMSHCVIRAAVNEIRENTISLALIERP